MRSQSGGKERKWMLLGVKSCEAKINLTSVKRSDWERREDEIILNWLQLLGKVKTSIY